ncbi:hypothetical protein CD116_11880 [Staphylococcus schweitzeri]|uniref:DUF1659 domain-containing protein n=1 Tax=Staphylococcus schweitzeri TaxID=1654388 RepID=A0A2K4AEG2_9STAP|nr:DUF1659 domain-containing protein [Staphylococcus schweitzeri]MBE2129068.1 hypothetical protein [Staphylococcus schweitzeri]PNZ48439.1 hypothetical protein CD116_11880 [Staphylococcus schweitzeri]CDR26640.1 hypothetical protein ERS140162_02104 [Staphylococcus schweitzeri]CDR27985.1 hypothetical protein ERS140147_01103 [Staphylococcus schweitzeri]CDR51480.1 hypothetical protein ERS140159_01434 [Staphylococcus schweitzeri]
MNKTNRITVVLSMSTTDANGKQIEYKRRFANISPESTNEQIKAFSKIIERLTGESYSNIEVIKSFSI